QKHPARLAQQESKSTDASDRSIPLSDKMLASRPGRSMDPAEIVAEQEEQDDCQAIEPIEVIRARFLAEATSGQRARLNRLPSAEQESELRAWDLTGDFLPDERP